MTTLKTLVDQFGATAFVFADAGNGTGFGAAGRLVDWDDATAAEYGQIEMQALDAPHHSDDGAECNFASDWQDGAAGYRFRVFF